MDEIVALLKENSKDNIPNVASLARSKSQDIAAAKAAVKDAPQEKQRIHIFTSGSDEHIFAKFYRQFLDKEETEELDAKVDTFGNANEAREWYKSKGYIQKGRQYILNQTVTSMQLAREGYDGQIEWSAEDAVNADPKFLLQLIRNVVIYA